jgi:hypothetical protein
MGRHHARILQKTRVDPAGHAVVQQAIAAGARKATFGVEADRIALHTAVNQEPPSTLPNKEQSRKWRFQCKVAGFHCTFPTGGEEHSQKWSVCTRFDAGKYAAVVGAIGTLVGVRAGPRHEGITSVAGTTVADNELVAVAERLFVPVSLHTTGTPVLSEQPHILSEQPHIIQAATPINHLTLFIKRGQFQLQVCTCAL